MKQDGEPDFKYEVRSGGGMGRAAIWEWSVYGPDRLFPVESGEVKGALEKANSAGREAVARWDAKSKKVRK
ncbi:MAG: hypothetical protein H0W66_09030 [Chthoniobacterales bacterium]|nr:hypothetical protein [Chthoniobacterales bacterium]